MNEALTAGLHLELTESERTFLLNLLEQQRKETLIEEHRTRNLSYRESIVAQEAVINNLLAKLGSTTG